MSNSPYLEALNSAREELSVLLARSDEIEIRISVLKQTIQSLANLVGEPDKNENNLVLPFVGDKVQEVGLTENVRYILRGTHTPLTSTQVKDKLITSGFDVGRYSNPLAPIHTVLRRLVMAGEARSTGNERGRLVYEWSRGKKRESVANALHEAASLQLQNP